MLFYGQNLKSDMYMCCSSICTLVQFVFVPVQNILNSLALLVYFELRLKYLIRRALYLGYRIRVAVD